jgi:gluconolactonase
MRWGLSFLCLILLPLSAASGDLTVVDANAKYPEGPLWKDGRLFYVEYAGPGVRVWDGQRSTDFWTKDKCGASGLISFNRRHLLVACYDANTIVEVDEQGKEVRSFTRDNRGKSFIGPNDFAPDGSGGVYFSASGVYDLKAPITGTVLHLSADGQTVVELADTIHYSNGLTLSKDGKSLLVAEMLAGRVLSFPVNADGSLGSRSVWARLQDLAPPTPNEDAYNGPDGLKLGPDGNYYIAQNGSGRVLVVNDDKKLIRTIAVPTRYVTNIAFGTSRDTVFITGLFDQWNAPFAGVVYRWTN